MDGKADNMQARAASVSGSVSLPLVGKILSGLSVLFLAVDGFVKLLAPEPVRESMAELGYPEHLAVAIGLLLLGCVAVYLIPRTAVLGAILLTGYLGGAIATHVRVENGPFELIFPVILGALLWGGLLLRDERLRSIVTPRG